MEKKRPHHDLEAFKRVCGDPRTLSIRLSAYDDAQDLGFGRADVAALVRSMRQSMFYKSMTSYSDSKVWQDVYHVPLEDGRVIYLKFRNDEIRSFTILSLKER